MGLYGASGTIWPKKASWTQKKIFLAKILKLQAHHVKAGIKAVTVMCLKFHNSQNLEISFFHFRTTRLGGKGR